MPDIPVTPQQLPSGFCPTSYQSMLNGFANAMKVTIPSTAEQIIASPTKPLDQSVIWLQLDSLGRPVRFYQFAQGAWLSLHPEVPGVTKMWFTTVPDFTTFDGGDSNAPGPQSGPMWQVALDNAGHVITVRFPLPVGILPDGTPVNPSGFGGEQFHTLTTAEGGYNQAHQHTIGRFADVSGALANDIYVLTGTSTFDGLGQDCAGANAGLKTSLLSALAGNYIVSAPAGPANTISPHNTTPLWIGCVFLQRTNRLYYAV